LKKGIKRNKKEKAINIIRIKDIIIKKVQVKKRRKRKNKLNRKVKKKPNQ